MFKVFFKGKQSGEVEHEQEVSLLASASTGSVPLTHLCGGHARCGTCLLTIEAGAEQLSPVGAAEARILKVRKADPDQRLGCQAWAHGDVTVRID